MKDGEWAEGEVLGQGRESRGRGRGAEGSTQESGLPAPQGWF